MQKSSLFHHKTIKKLCEKTDLTYKQKEASVKWLSYLDAGDLKKEKSNYPKFMKIILQDILGFPMEDIGQEDENVDMLYPQKGEKVLCVECKGTGTTELDALQHRDKKEHETPIKQTWDYVGSTGSDYGICTNYKEFVLMTRTGYPALHWFDFESIREKPDEKLKEFVGIFSKESLIDKSGFVEDLHKESVEEEREFTKEFYKLFHQTRLMMIKAFQEKEGVTKDEAINYAQLYLNRLIFIFFAEDNKLLEKKLFMETVKKSLNSNIFESSKSVSNQILDLFSIMDKGSNKLGIIGFGGELFQERIPSKIHFLDLKDKKFFNDITNKIKLKIKPDNTVQSIIDREKKLNPITKNLLMMDSFDFTTELNVNILGRIFEQSISDLEELKEEKVSKQKREGVYYTPEYITDYICRNTIIPYLSKSGTNSIQTLIYEYENNIEELEKKFREIKILDPACGSGAFLIKAVDILLEIHKEILNLKQFLRPEKYSDNGQAKMDKWNEESEAKEIIENNIYGVDINSESVAVTKLALFLKIAERGKRLSGLTNNIKVGNSLISDKSIDEMAFDWEVQFPEKFDIVIGNPPYISNWQLSKNDRKVVEYLDKEYRDITMGHWDLYIIFIRKGLCLLKKGGYLSFIVPSSFFMEKYGKKLRELIVKDYSLDSLVDFGNEDIFDDVARQYAVFNIQNMLNKENLTKIFRFKKKQFLELDSIKQKDFLKFQNCTFRTDLSKKDLTIKEKMSSNSIFLGNICCINVGVVAHSKADSPQTFKKDDVIHNSYSKGYKKYVEGRKISRHNVKWTKQYMDYDSKYKFFHRPKFPQLFERNKIIVRRVSGKNNLLIVVYDEDEFYTNDNLMHVVLWDDETVKLQNPGKEFNVESMYSKFLLTYVAGILSSKLISYLFKKTIATGTLQGTYSGVYPEDLRKLPIKIASNEQQQKMSTLIKKITSLNKNLNQIDAKTEERISIENEIKETDNDIDQLVYSLYGITEDEKKVIEEEN